MSENRANNDTLFSSSSHGERGDIEVNRSDFSFAVPNDAITLDGVAIENCIKSIDSSNSGETLNASSASASSGSSGRTLLGSEFNDYSNKQSPEAELVRQVAESSVNINLGNFLSNGSTAEGAMLGANSEENESRSLQMQQSANYTNAEISNKFDSKEQEFDQESGDDENEDNREFTPLARTVSVSPSSRSSSPLPTQDDSALFGYSTVFPMYSAHHHGRRHHHGMLHAGNQGPLSTVHPSFIYKTASEGFFRHPLDTTLALGPESAFGSSFVQGNLPYQVECGPSHLEALDSVSDSSVKSVTSFPLSPVPGYNHLVSMANPHITSNVDLFDTSTLKNVRRQAQSNLAGEIPSTSPNSTAPKEGASGSMSEVQWDLIKADDWTDNVVVPKSSLAQKPGPMASLVLNSAGPRTASDYHAEDPSVRALNMIENQNTRSAHSQFEVTFSTQVSPRAQTSMGYGYGIPQVGSNLQGQVTSPMSSQNQKGLSRDQLNQGSQSNKLFGAHLTPMPGTNAYNNMQGNFYSISDYVSPSSSIRSSTTRLTNDMANNHNNKFLDAKPVITTGKHASDNVIQLSDSASAQKSSVIVPRKIESSTSLLTSASSQSQAASQQQARADRIPRPENSFFLYRRNVYANVVEKNPGKTNPEISKIISAMWKREGPAVKRMFKELSIKTKLDHELKYPNYKYQPRRDKKQKKKLGQQITAAQLSSISGNRIPPSLSTQRPTKNMNANFNQPFLVNRPPPATGSIGSKAPNSQMQSSHIATQMPVQTQFTGGMQMNFANEQRKHGVYSMGAGTLSGNSNSPSSACFGGHTSSLTSAPPQYFQGNQRISGPVEMMPFYNDDGTHGQNTGRAIQSFPIGRIQTNSAESTSFKAPTFALQQQMSQQYTSRIPPSPSQPPVNQFARSLEYSTGPSRVLLNDRMPHMYAVNSNSESSFSLPQGVMNVPEAQSFRNNQVSGDISLNRNSCTSNNLKILGGNGSISHDNTSGLSLGYDSGVNPGFNYPGPHSFPSGTGVDSRQLPVAQHVQFHGRQPTLPYHTHDNSGHGQQYSQIPSTAHNIPPQQAHSIHYNLPHAASNYQAGNATQLQQHHGLHGSHQQSPQQKHQTSQQAQVSQHSQHQPNQSQSQQQQPTQSSFSMSGSSLLGVQFDFAT